MGASVLIIIADARLTGMREIRLWTQSFRHFRVWLCEYGSHKRLLNAEGEKEDCRITKTILENFKEKLRDTVEDKFWFIRALNSALSYK